jgi:hypothetical protein
LGPEIRARDRLSPAESALRGAVGRGRDLNLGGNIDPRSATDTTAWASDRIVRASVIEDLLRDLDNRQVSALRLTGARITGPLRLQHGRLGRPLHLDLCWIDEVVTLVDLAAAGIELVRCRLPGLRAESVDISGALTMRECSAQSVVIADTRVERSVSFADSRITDLVAPFRARNLVVGGDVVLTGARLFTRSGEDALRAERLRVENALTLTGIRARGSVVLAGAIVGGRVEAADAVVRNGAGVALDLQHLSAAGFDGSGLRCTGTVDLRHASISGVVSFDGATVHRPEGDAIRAGDIEADRFQAEDGARVNGRVGIPRARIRDTLAMRGLDLVATDGPALLAVGAGVGVVLFDDVRVVGELVFDEMTATTVRLAGARTRGHGRASSVSMRSANIRRALRLDDIETHGTLDLQGIRVGAVISLDRARLDGHGRRALNASRVVVGDRMVFGEAFVAHGDVDLAHADIGKSLAMDGSCVVGTVRLFQARVRSDVLVRGAYIEADGMGLDAIGLRVDGRITARGLVCDGAVRLTAAVADSVIFTGAQVHNPDGNALIAPRIDVRGDLIAGDDPYARLRGSFRAVGGVVLRDAHVGGDLVFDGGEFTHPTRRALDATGIDVGGKVSMHDVRVSGTAVLDQARVRRRIIVSDAGFGGPGLGSVEGPVVFSALQVTSDELLIDGGQFCGAVRLGGSTFAVGVSVRSTTFRAEDGVALAAGDMSCVVLRLTDLEVYGAVALAGVRTGGDLVVEGGTYRNAGRVAIDAGRSTVAGTLSISATRLLGTLVLRRAQVGLGVLLHSTDIADGASPDGVPGTTGGQAIAAAGLRIDGNLECRALTTSGQISLADAVLNGRFIVRGPSHLTHPRRAALYAPGLQVDGAASFGVRHAEPGQELTIVGAIRFDQAKLAALSFRGVVLRVDTEPGSTPVVAEPAGTAGHATVPALVTMRQAVVTHGLTMDGLEIVGTTPGAESVAIDLSELRAGSVELPQGDCAIDLRDAEVRSLVLDPADARSVMLSGLTFDDPGGADVETALRWLRRDPHGYQHQAYEQLAAHYRRMGDDQAARTVLLERQRHRRDLLRPSSFGQLLMKGWGYLQDVTVGYGYRPGLAAVWFVGALISGTAYFWGRSLDPVEVHVHPTFNPFGYTLDLLIPLLSFGQDLAWDPRGPDLWVAYTLVLAGAVLATTVAAAVTRVLNRS